MVSQFMRDGVMARWPPLSPERLATVEQLDAFAGDHGHTLLELAISWVASQPAIGSVLTGVTNPSQVLANATACAWRLTADDMANVNGIVAREGTPA